MPVNDFHTFVSPQYTVLRSVVRPGESDNPMAYEQAALSLGLIVGGVPSFLGTIPVDVVDLDDVVVSLDRGKVRVAAVGISVDGNAMHGATEREAEPWRPEVPIRSLPAAFLSLVCADGRRIGIARIVSRQDSAVPEDIARFVLRQIARGVQIPDLASTP